VGASKVDDLLLEILRAFLLPTKAKGQNNDELLEGDRPLATFSSRIKICRRLGLIDETLYRALEQLRALRNLSAYETSFDHAEAPARDPAPFMVAASGWAPPMPPIPPALSTLGMGGGDSAPTLQRVEEFLRGNN
jgi:DNA-binding MltR family transcriptional regulator